MLIGIEATRANKPYRTGVEWYAFHVIQELKKITAQEGHSWLLYSNASLIGGLEKLPSQWYDIRVTWPFPFGWTQFRLSWELYRRPIDVLWLPGSVLPRYCPKKTVVTVHDIGFHRFPHLYKKRQRAVHEYAMREIKKRGYRILTVSHFSAKEISDVYGISPQLITVTYNGIDHAVYRTLHDKEGVMDRLRKYRIGGPFFLSIGRLEQKKNILTLIRAFTSFKQSRGIGDPYKLVLIGIPGFGYEEIKKAIASSSVRADILELGYVQEDDLPSFMNMATALIHPAIYEGFGIPPVQAMACGCPVIASRATCLPEVLGEAALYAAPDEPEAFSVHMQTIVEDEELVQELKQKGITQASLYTWKATAEATMAILTSK